MVASLNFIDVFAPGTLKIPNHDFRCALGPSGIHLDKTEGDGVTPAGSFALRRVFYRSDRMEAPETGLSVQALTPIDGWCDDPDHKKYNRFVSLPFAGSHEDLWREDHVYDIIVEVGYNDDPPVPMLGSAIFMHIAREIYDPTQGCVALAEDDLRIVLRHCNSDTRLRINL